MLKKLTKKIVEFRNNRDWKQFHTPKNLAISLSLEASEVLDHFQWKDDDEVASYINSHKKEIGDELADVLSYILLLSHDLDIDLTEAFKQKMLQNEVKYPVDKAKGNNKKYTEL